MDPRRPCDTRSSRSVSTSVSGDQTHISCLYFRPQKWELDEGARCLPIRSKSLPLIFVPYTTTKLKEMTDVSVQQSLSEHFCQTSSTRSKSGGGQQVFQRHCEPQVRMYRKFCWWYCSLLASFVFEWHIKIVVKHDSSLIVASRRRFSMFDEWCLKVWYCQHCWSFFMLWSTAIASMIRTRDRLHGPMWTGDTDSVGLFVASSMACIRLALSPGM